jgi:hypothetical protein
MAMKEHTMTWMRVASGNTRASLEMYEKDYQRQGTPTKWEKDVSGRWVLYALINNYLNH